MRFRVADATLEVVRLLRDTSRVGWRHSNSIKHLQTEHGRRSAVFTQATLLGQFVKRHNLSLHNREALPPNERARVLTKCVLADAGCFLRSGTILGRIEHGLPFAPPSAISID